MPTNCLTERSEPLVAAASREKHEALSRRVLEISGEMNGRGIIHSSTYVNSVAEAFAAALHDLAAAAWGVVQRAHESCGRQDAQAIFPYFTRILESETDKLESVLQDAVGNVASGLQNKSMLRLQAVSDAHAHLIQKYKGEIEIYVANLERPASGTLLDRLKSRFKNNPIVAALLLVIAVIAGAATFTDSLVKLDSFVRKVLGDG